ncbi:DIMBOA UDP-glucosyltransferase BX8-like [Triticum aestivum]|uniref:Glycosyltransferase n=1 Tax=Aegilops tauschii subsp. strangulata TaxID=200361 RepID=A0A453JK40_AEGTS|nr:DIMBOA UDP-glucosyltransferase BX8-like [Triticum aestivum]
MATQEIEKAPHAVRRRVVLFPLPFQGHLSPMLQLAELLRARGLAVTVLHTDFNAPDPARHPELAFVSIHEALPHEATSPDADIVAQLLALNSGCEAPFREALASLLLLREDVACVVVDGQWYAALGAAGALGVPVLALRTDSAATFGSLLAFPRLRDAGYVPIKEERRDDELVPELEPLRVRDLIRIDGSDVDALRGFIARVADAVRASASGVLLNSFDAIEAPELARIEKELSCPAFAVGPLHRMCPGPAPAEHGLHVPDRRCLAWLDAHPPRSVLYVSLGSVARVDRGVFEEMAWGLAGSGVPFLWVVRPGSVRGGGADELPNGLDEGFRSRGKVVAWAPQLEVLAHEAVGAFWTHCGWNSTLEGVCAGVPMLAQPCFADQTVNARYVTHRWGVGLEVGDVIDRARVAARVRMVMAGEEGDRARERARQLKLQADQCVAASFALDNLVQYVLSL